MESTKINPSKTPPEPIVFKVIMGGGREMNDYDFFTIMCDRYLADKIAQGYVIEIVSGGARGADCLAILYAQERGFQLKVFPANWKKYGKRAGAMRNAEMADYAEALIAFWNKKSPGTKNMITLAELNFLPVRIAYCHY